MAAPIYNNAQAFVDAGFIDNLTGNFDVGTGTNIGVLCLAFTNNNSQNITGVTIGGVSMTAETAVELGAFGDTGEYRVYRLAGQSFTGSQAFSVTADNTNGKLNAIFYAVKDCTAVASVTNGNGSGYTMTQTVASDTNSLVVAMWSLIHGGTAAADSPTVERLESSSTHHSLSYVLEEAGATSTTVSTTVTGGGTPGWFGPIFSLTGTGVSAPVLTTPTGSATGKDAGTAGATTDVGSGTMYGLARIGGSQASGPTIVSTGVSLAISSTGAKTIPQPGLTAGSTYVVDICHNSAGGNSNVVTSPSFTPTTLALTGSLSAQSGVTGTSLAWTGATPDSLVTGAGIGTRVWTISNAGGSGLTSINSSTGVVSGSLPAAASYTIQLTVTDGSTAGTEVPQTETISFGLTVNSSGAASSVTMSGPSGGVVSVASTTFAVGANGTISGTVTVTPSDSGGGGTFSPTSVAISSGTPTATFTYTPGTVGAKSISVTNSGGLANPTPITYTVTGGSGGTITLTGFKQWTGSVHTSVNVNFVKVFRLSTGALTLERTAMAIDGSGNSAITDAALTTAVDYMVFGFNATGSLSFKKKVTAT